jgi:hypothetical protein
MGRKLLLAQAFEARAGEARSLAEAQALHAEADRLRRPRQGAFARFTGQPLFRN